MTEGRIKVGGGGGGCIMVSSPNHQNMDLTFNTLDIALYRVWFPGVIVAPISLYREVHTAA